MKSNYLINHNELIIGDTVVTFKANIFQILEINHHLIVYLSNDVGMDSVSPANDPDNNVFAVDSTGKIIWQINELIGRDEYFTGMGVTDSGQLFLLNFYGLVRIFNPTTWEIVGTTITK